MYYQLLLLDPFSFSCSCQLPNWVRHQWFLLAVLSMGRPCGHASCSTFSASSQAAALCALSVFLSFCLSLSLCLVLPDPHSQQSQKCFQSSWKKMRCHVIPTWNPSQNWASSWFLYGGLPFVKANEVEKRPRSAAGVCLGFSPLLQLSSKRSQPH